MQAAGTGGSVSGTDGAVVTLHDLMNAFGHAFDAWIRLASVLSPEGLALDAKMQRLNRLIAEMDRKAR